MALHDAFYHAAPDLSFHLTDTVGGPPGIFEREDPESQITIHIRSGHKAIHKLFHMYGRVAAIPYVVAETHRLVEEDRRRRPERHPRKVVVVGNAAPRDDGKNGVEFHTARLGEYVQIIAPPSAFSLVKNKIHDGFYRIPNESNTVFPRGSQFRSSYVEEIASDPASLVPADISVIPAPPVRPTLAYADFFGNQKLWTPDDDAFERDLKTSAVQREGRRIIGLQIGDLRRDFHLLSTLYGTSAGDYIAYRNSDRGGQHNLAWVWPSNASDERKQKNSPHAIFQEPPEGAPVTIR